MKPLRILEPAISGVVVCIYFLYSAWGGIFAYFTMDDLMNLYGYWTKPTWRLITDNILFFGSAFRPMGGFFYLPLFTLFGFEPLFRFSGVIRSACPAACAKPSR